MILSFDEAGALLDEMAEEFPPEFYDELNGGIALLPEAKEDSEGEPGELYIMGEYCNDMMGKYINLYYGSFAALAEQEDWTEEDWEDELYTTLAHEFTHHIEGRAGERGLERKDEQFIGDEAAAEDGGAPVKTLQNLPEGMQAVQMKPAVVGKVQAAGDKGGVSANRRRAFVRPSAPNAEAAVVSSGLKAVSADTEADVEVAPAEGEASDTAAVSASPAAVRAETPAAQAAPVQRRQFRCLSNQ